VTAPAGTTAWWWSNGDTTVTTYATDAGRSASRFRTAVGAWRIRTRRGSPSIRPPLCRDRAERCDPGSTPADAYQWLLEGSPIGGANGQTYDPTVNGNYQVITTDVNGCTAVSDTLLLLTVSIADNAGHDLSLWPSPAVDLLHIDGPEAAMPSRVEIVANDGRTMLVQVPRDGTIDVSRLATGVYQARMHWSDGHIVNMPFVKR
jgi:hypothetical protein